MVNKDRHSRNLPSGRVVAIIIVIILILGYIIFHDQIAVFVQSIVQPIMGPGGLPSDRYDMFG